MISNNWKKYHRKAASMPKYSPMDTNDHTLLFLHGNQIQH